MKYTQCSLFKGINENQIKQLNNCLKMREEKYEALEEICSYNNSSQVVGVILSGKAYVKKLDKNGNYTILETLYKDSIFGAVLSYTETESNFISVFAVEPTVVLFLDYDCVFKRCQKACEYHSTLVINLMNKLLDRTRILSQRVEILSNKTIKDKFLSYISLTAIKEQKLSFTIPMSYTSLAEYLSVDRSALMREIKKLSDSGIIKVNKKEITILSKEYI